MMAAQKEARWKLGRLLSKIERGRAGQPKKNVLTRLGHSFRTLLKTLGLTDPLAIQAQRIGAMPEAAIEKIFARAQMVTGSPAPSRS
jgi:hypothetical protein